MKASEIQEALKLESEDKPLEALVKYEMAFSNNEGELKDYINAAVLLFVIQDYGTVFHHKIPQGIVDEAWGKSMNFLENAEKLFGPNPEIDFWKPYFAFALHGEPSFEDEARRMMKKGTDIPCFHIISDANDLEMLEKCRSLFKEVSSGETAKERYIKSVLEAVFLHLKGEKPKK
jgi:hypothetical protein